MKYKCPGIIEDWCGDLPAGLGTPEPDTKCQIVTQSQLDRIEAKLDLLLEQKKRKPRQKVTGDTHFDSFWKHYPVKKGKQAAQRAFQNAKATTLNLIMDVENRIANDAQWIAGYIPHASTYLNGARWEDEITPVVTQAETLPKENSDLVAWAGNKGFRAPRPGESFTQYRMAITELYRSV